MPLIDVVGMERELRRRGVSARRARIWLARRDVNTFCELVLKHEKTGERIRQAPFHPAWHRLADKHPRLIIWASTEAAKSHQISVGRVLWLLGRDPSLRIGIFSNTATQAEKFSKLVRHYIESSEDLHEVFPGLRPSPVLWTESAYVVRRDSFAKDPSVQAVGVGGKILGARLDLAILDDILDEENTRSESSQTAVEAWFNQTVMSRLQDYTRNVNGVEVPVEARLIMVGTAWNPRDLMHTLAKREGFVARKFPILDQQGCSRWPEVWPESRIAKVKRTDLTPLEFARQKLLKPYDENTARFRVEWIEAAKRAGEGLPLLSELGPEARGVFAAISIGVDVSVGESARGDLTAATAIGILPDETRRLLAIRRGRVQGPEILKWIIDWDDAFSPDIILVENVAAQQYLLQFLRGVSAAPVRPFTTGKQKADPTYGVESLATEFFNEKWIVPSRAGRCHPDVEALLEAMMFYRPGKHTPDELMSLWFAREGYRRLRARDRK